MVQPGTPYQNQGSGGQQPWEQPPAPQTTSWNLKPDPRGNIPVSAPTAGWQAPPPPPPKSNIGLIIGLIAGAVVLLSVAAVVGLFVYGGEDGQNPVASPSTAASGTPSSKGSPSKDVTSPGTLDSAETDETALTTTAMFPDTSFTGASGEKYALAGTLEASACTGVGSGKARSVMKEHDCGRMVVGVYLTAAEKLFSALLVIPFKTDSDAEAVHAGLDADKQDVINALTYYCPSDNKPGATLCERGSDDLPTWYASFTAFHRNVFITISLYTDGHRTENMSEVDDVTADTVGYVTDVLLGLR